MIWILLVSWNLKTPTFVPNYVSMSFDTEQECHDAEKRLNLDITGDGRVSIECVIKTVIP